MKNRFCPSPRPLSREGYQVLCDSLIYTHIFYSTLSLQSILPQIQSIPTVIHPSLISLQVLLFICPHPSQNKLKRLSILNQYLESTLVQHILFGFEGDHQFLGYMGLGVFVIRGWECQCMRHAFDRNSHGLDCTFIQREIETILVVCYRHVLLVEFGPQNLFELSFGRKLYVFQGPFALNRRDVGNVNSLLFIVFGVDNPKVYDLISLTTLLPRSVQLENRAIQLPEQRDLLCVLIRVRDEQFPFFSELRSCGPIIWILQIRFEFQFKLNIGSCCDVETALHCLVGSQVIGETLCELVLCFGEEIVGSRVCGRGDNFKLGGVQGLEAANQVGSCGVLQDDGFGVLLTLFPGIFLENNQVVISEITYVLIQFQVGFYCASLGDDRHQLHLHLLSLLVEEIRLSNQDAFGRLWCLKGLIRDCERCLLLGLNGFGMGMDCEQRVLLAFRLNSLPIDRNRIFRPQRRRADANFERVSSSWFIQRIDLPDQINRSWSFIHYLKLLSDCPRVCRETPKVVDREYGVETDPELIFRDPNRSPFDININGEYLRIVVRNIHFQTILEPPTDVVEKSDFYLYLTTPFKFTSWGFTDYSHPIPCLFQVLLLGFLKLPLRNKGSPHLGAKRGDLPREV